VYSDQNRHIYLNISFISIQVLHPPKVGKILKLIRNDYL